MQKFLKSIAWKVRKGELSLALTETKQSVSEQDRVGQKVQCYLLLKNQKYPEADALATKMLSSGLDHELLCWRGIARAELGLWFSALEDLCLSQEIFPKRSTKKRIDHTTRRACENISEGMVISHEKPAAKKEAQQGGKRHDFKMWKGKFTQQNSFTVKLYKTVHGV